jgi:2-keto-4-pentenoate hydratase/2-oxohepta-3-ene-1,7-dioic acid hydratase in catechol pathway
MRVASLFLDQKFRPVILISPERYLDVRTQLDGFDGDMIDFIARVPELKKMKLDESKAMTLGNQTLAAPIPLPSRNIFCIGKNYLDHVKEMTQAGRATPVNGKEDVPTVPIVFTKAPSTVIASGEKIEPHTGLTSQLDYEAELAVVIGRGGKGIKKSDAMNHVWGYTVLNDVTARDLQKEHRQWFLGKSLDTFCPMGPSIVSADETDGKNLKVQTWINGELRQDGNTNDFIFDIPTLIETISAGITLQPGDLIATGTPSGVGAGFSPPKFLKSGDEIKITIERVGTLMNTVK